MNGCTRFVDLLHARLDGELAEGDARELIAHLETCTACRELASGFDATRESLRGLGHRTVRSESRVVPFRSRRARVFAGVGLASAAAALAAALIVPMYRSSHPSDAEVAKARQDALRALAIAGRALKRAETAGNAVVIDEVSPALRRVPLRWDRLAEEPRRNRS